MGRGIYKFTVISVWILIVFGYLFLMQKVYEKEQSFYLFVLLALAGNLAYDGLKSLLTYRAFYSSDAKSLAKYAVLSVAFLFLSVGSFFLGAAMHVYFSIPLAICKGVSLVGYLVSIAMSMNCVSKAENIFRVSNNA